MPSTSENYLAEYKKSKLTISKNDLNKDMTLLLIDAIICKDVVKLNEKLAELRKQTNDIKIINAFLFLVEYMYLREEESKCEAFDVISIKIPMPRSYYLPVIRTCFSHNRIYIICKKCGTGTTNGEVVNGKFCKLKDIRFAYMANKYNYCIHCDQKSSFTVTKSQALLNSC